MDPMSSTDYSSDVDPYFFFLLKKESRDPVNVSSQLDEQTQITSKNPFSKNNSLGDMASTAMVRLESRGIISQDSSLTVFNLNSLLLDQSAAILPTLTPNSLFHPMTDFGNQASNLIERSARVELESILLKKLMKDEVLDTLNSIKSESSKSYTSVEQHIAKVDAKMKAFKNSRNHTNDFKKLDSKLDFLLEKVEHLEQDLTKVNGIIESQDISFSQMDKSFNNNTTQSKPSLPVPSFNHADKTNLKRIREHCDNLVKKVNKIQKSDNTDIKEFLCFMLGRVLGIEKSISTLSKCYQVIVERENGMNKQKSESPIGENNNNSTLNIPNSSRRTSGIAKISNTSRTSIIASTPQKSINKISSTSTPRIKRKIL